jgi:Tfp pilus assembly protein FimT
MKKVNNSSQSGISIIETLTILTVLAILVTFAVAQFGNSKNSFQRQNIARELKVSLERARFDSVKRRATTTTDLSDLSRVTINDATSFTVATDLNQDGTLGTNETRKVSFPTQDGIRLIAASTNFPINIYFDRRGQITAQDSTKTSIAPIFTICTNCTAQTASASNAHIISVSATGTVSMTSGGVTQPTFANPTVTNGNFALSNLLKVN